MQVLPTDINKIYLMAICGTGMGSLAGMFKEKGYEVCGSDHNVYPPMSDELRDQGIAIYSPFSKENLETAKPDLVIVGNAITRKNPEAQFLLQSDIPYLTMPEALQHFFFQDKQVIAVTGTHGKTTTTALLAHLLTELGADPSFLVGGVTQNAGRNFRLGSGKFFVIEGDEYDTAFYEKTPKFLHYQPRHVIATSLEFDHADIYQNVEEIEAAFSRLFDIIPTQGSLHFCSAYARLDILAKSKMGQVAYFMRRYGTEASAWQIKNYQASDQGSSFDLCVKDRLLISVQSPLTGLYNAQNVTACFSVLDHLGFDLTRANQALQSFAGVKRRQEIIYQDNERVVIDDFAHHPTAVKETIQAIKEKFPEHKLIAVFEPRSNTTRRSIFTKEYIDSFLNADSVYLAPVNQPEKVLDGHVLDVGLIIQELTAQGVEAYGPLMPDDIVKQLTVTFENPTAILVMSNGSFDGICEKLKQHNH